MHFQFCTSHSSGSLPDCIFCLHLFRRGKAQHIDAGLQYIPDQYQQGNITLLLFWILLLENLGLMIKTVKGVGQVIKIRTYPVRRLVLRGSAHHRIEPNQFHHQCHVGFIFRLSKSKSFHGAAFRLLAFTVLCQD